MRISHGLSLTPGALLGSSEDGSSTESPEAVADGGSSLMSRSMLNTKIAGNFHDESDVKRVLEHTPDTWGETWLSFLQATAHSLLLPSLSAIIFK